AGLDEPDRGHVAVAGARLTRRPESHRAALRARHIGVLLQSGNLIEHLTVEGNIALAQSLAGPQAGSRRDTPAELLAGVGLTGRGGARPRRCRVAKPPGQALPSPWPTTRRSCWPTSQPARSTRPTRNSCSICSAAGSTRAG